DGPPGATGTGRSMLENLQECDGNGVCKGGTVFGYTPEAPVFEQIDTGISDLSPAITENYWILNVGDYNGDGKDDILYRALKGTGSDHGGSDIHEDWQLRLSNGAGFGNAFTVGARDVNDEDIGPSAGLPDRGFFAKWNFGVTTDIDMDGVADFLAVKGHTPPDPQGFELLPHYRFFKGLGTSVGFHWVDASPPGDFRAEQNGQQVFQVGNIDTELPRPLYLADLNGDGLVEPIRPAVFFPSDKKGTWHYRANDSKTLAEYQPILAVEAEPPAVIGGQAALGTEFCYTIDLDGDGKTEFIYGTSAAPPPGQPRTYLALNFDQAGKAHIRKSAISVFQRT